MIFDDLIVDIQSRMVGRICWEEHNCNYLAGALLNVEGDHLEIGTLHGGTAILAALIKKQYNRSGHIYCIDPLDGYYTGTKYACETDPITHTPVTVNVVMANLAIFDVEDMVTIIQTRSTPFPKFEGFASAFIDGDHWGDGPLTDWLNVYPITTDVVVFDNADQKHPDVLRAVTQASSTTGWRLQKHEGITAVLERLP